jgi:hypothetical protein
MCKQKFDFFIMIVDGLTTMVFVYKSNGDYVVTLEKLHDTIHNENITQVFMRQYALYRANKLKVVAIEHKYITGKTLQEMEYTCFSYNVPNLWHFHSNDLMQPVNVLYKVGEVVECTDFCTKLHVNWTPGIQYYLDKQVAIDIEHTGLQTGTATIYWPDGRFDCSVHYKDGLLHREDDLPAIESYWYQAWYKNGDRWRDDENAPMIVYNNGYNGFIGNIGRLTRKEYEQELLSSQST